MKIFFMFVSVGILAVVGWYIFFSQKSETKQNTPPQKKIQSTISPTSVDYSASFAIFTNGTFRIFTSAMYHNLSPDVFIQADNPNIVRVKKAGITWDDFFKTLPMKLTKECLTTGTGQTFCTNINRILKFYLNGRLDPNALDRTINHGDQLLVTFGNETQSQIQNQLQQIPAVK